MLILKLSLMKNFKNSSLRRQIEINNPILDSKLSKDKSNTYPRVKVIYIKVYNTTKIFSKSEKIGSDLNSNRTELLCYWIIFIMSLWCFGSAGFNCAWYNLERVNKTVNPFFSKTCS